MTTHTTNLMRSVAAAAALSLSFGAVAQPVAPVAHSFVTDKSPAGNNARNAYTASITNIVDGLAKGNTTARLTSGSYAVQLEEQLANLPAKFTPFVAPREYQEHMFQLHGIGPTAQFPHGHATMCAAQNGKVLAAWKIYLSPTTYYQDGKQVASYTAGQVVERPVVPNTPEMNQQGRPACWGTLLSGRDEIRTDHNLFIAPAPVPTR